MNEYVEQIETELGRPLLPFAAYHAYRDGLTVDEFLGEYNDVAA